MLGGTGRGPGQVGIEDLIGRPQQIVKMLCCKQQMLKYLSRIPCFVYYYLLAINLHADCKHLSPNIDHR